MADAPARALALEFMNELGANGAAIRVQDLQDDVPTFAATGVLEVLAAHYSRNLKDSGEQRFGLNIWTEPRWDDRCFQLRTVFGTEGPSKVMAAATIPLPFNRQDGLGGYLSLTWRDDQHLGRFGVARIRHATEKIVEGFAPPLFLARTRRALARKVEQLQEVAHHTRRFAASRHLGTLGIAVLDALVTASSMNAGAIFVRDKECGDWARIAQHPADGQGFPRRIPTIDRDKDLQLLRIAESNRKAQPPEFSTSHLSELPATSLDFPLEFEGEILGVVWLRSEQPVLISSETQAFLQMICDSAALALNSSLLAKASEDLEGPFALMGRTIGGILHVLRNIANNMGSAFTLLQNSEITDEQRPTLWLIVDKELARARSVIESVALLAKPRGKTTPVDIGEVVKKEASEVAQDFPELTRRILVDLDELQPGVIVDANLAGIEIAIRMLIQNAYEALNESGGNLWLRAKKKNGKAIIMVADSGPGMDSLTRKKCLIPFFTTKETGNGLGLSVALGIARRHGGNLRVKSIKGRGAAFAIFLPAAEGES